MITEVAFKQQTQLNYKAIRHLLYLEGLPCKIYFPQSEETIYNDSSQSYVYSDMPDIEERCLITGIYGLSEYAGLEIENYPAFNDDEGKMYVIGENTDIPRNSKVEVFFEEGLKVFRTQNKRVVHGLNGDPLYASINIVPVS
jgi:hypothetical protein